MQFQVEKVHAAHPWAIRNATGNRHISKFFATENEAQKFANAMNQAWFKMERKSVNRAIEAAEVAIAQ